MEFKADLHIHTCLSPCAEPEMVPTAIVAAARNAGLDAIAICDHNTAENVAAVKACAGHTGLLILGGMEITSVEEVHILGLFGDEKDVEEMQRFVLQGLEGKNDEARFGYQWIVDETDSVIGTNDQLLIGATTYTVDDIVRKIHETDGVAIAAHIDRESFSLLGQLGFIPPGLGLDGLEVSARYMSQRETGFEQLGLPLLCSSDAHFLADVGKGHTILEMKEATFKEFTMALRSENGRGVRLP